MRVVAAELGLAEAAVYRWKAQDLVDRGVKPGTSTSERGKLISARRRIKELETELTYGHGVIVNRKTVQKIMRIQGLHGLPGSRKTFRSKRKRDVAAPCRRPACCCDLSVRT